MIKGFALAAAAALFTAVALAGTASAQYPPPNGSLVCTTNINVTINQTEIGATLRSSSGDPVVGKTLTFTVAGGTKTAVTNEFGQAAVSYSGTSVTATVVYEDLSCAAVAQVAGSTFRPPSTGDGGLIGDSNSDTVVFAGALVIMAVTGLSLVALRRRETVKND